MSTNANSKARNQAEFKKNRKKILGDGAPCHWCGNLATEADHVIPTIEGGTNDISNLVPACKPCNARRGQATKTRRERERNGTLITAQTQYPQGKQNENTESVFFQSPEKPPQGLYRISDPINTTVLTDRPELATTGRQYPRLETTTESGFLSVGNEVAEFALEVLNVELMPWQRHVLNQMTAYDMDNGLERWRHRVAMVSVARQNGKTTAIAALVGWWLATQGKRRGQKQTVITVAHKLDLATSLFTYLAPILEARFNASVSWSYGRMSLTMPDGSTWLVRAATPQAGHGYSADLVIVDEVWAVSEAAIDDGLLPSQRARKNPLLAMWSTAGTQDSHAMLRWREQGLRAIDSGQQTSCYFAEFSPPPSVDFMTMDAWQYSNPALGHTLEPAVLLAEAEAPNRSAFLRASVNVFTATTSGWLEPGIFEQLQTTEPCPPGGVLAVEVSTDESRYYAVRAVSNGKITHVTIAFTADTLAECWRLIEAELTSQPTLRLAIVPSLDVHVPPHLERRRVIVGYRELLKWTGAVRSMIIENRIRHNGQHVLNEHVERAVMIKHQGSVAISSTRSPGPVEACRCMIWAVALASKPVAVGKPVVVSNAR
jgi:hypothetical protein